MDEKFTLRRSYGHLPPEETDVICGIQMPENIESNHSFSGEAILPNTPAQIGEKLEILRQHDPRAPGIMKDMYIAKLGHSVDGRACSMEERLLAAKKITYQLLDDTYINNIFQRITTKLGDRAHGKTVQTIYIPIRGGQKAPTEQSNILERVYEIELIRKLNKKLEHWNGTDKPSIHFSDGLDEGKAIIGLTREKDGKPRALLGPYERIFVQKKFGFPNFKKGDLVWLGDDHVQNGGTEVTRWNGLREIGVEVLGFSSLTALPESKNFRATPAVTEALMEAVRYAGQRDYADPQKGVDVLKEMLGMVGISYETLTKRESLLLITMLLEHDKEITLPSGKKVNTTAWFNDVAIAAGYNPKLDLCADALQGSLRDPVMPLPEMQKHVKDAIDNITFKAREV